MFDTESVGYVYILTSKNCDSVKIGGSDYPPIKRIKEINQTEPYKKLGKWELADFRQVNNWRKVEHYLHYRFRSCLNTNQANQKELFYLSVKEASDALNDLDENLIIYKPKVDRMFQDEYLCSYLKNLFILSGLVHWLEYQGVWTFSLFPSTNGGRYFTLNIGSHEVAFSTLNKKNTQSTHMILLDKLILDFPETISWIEQNGYIEKSYYKTVLPRAVSIFLNGPFDIALDFLKKDGVRRALIAYWYDSLFNLKDSNKCSVYARFHNYNAIAKFNTICSAP